MMFITTDICDQIITCFLGRSFCAKELRAHVVVDSNHMRALLRESLDRFRTDQSRRSRDDDCAHLAYSMIILAITQDDCPRIQIASPAEGSARDPGNRGVRCCRPPPNSPGVAQPRGRLRLYFTMA